MLPSAAIFSQPLSMTVLSLQREPRSPDLLRRLLRSLPSCTAGLDQRLPFLGDRHVLLELRPCAGEVHLGALLGVQLLDLLRLGVDDDVVTQPRGEDRVLAV